MTETPAPGGTPWGTACGGPLICSTGPGHAVGGATAATPAGAAPIATERSAAADWRAAGERPANGFEGAYEGPTARGAATTPAPLLLPAPAAGANTGLLLMSPLVFTRIGRVSAPRNSTRIPSLRAQVTRRTNRRRS